MPRTLALLAAAGVAVGSLLIMRQLRQRRLAASNTLTISDDERQTLDSTTDDDARVALLKVLFAQLHGTTPTHIAKAGGRVNLIGEHVDYPDVQFSGDPKVHLFSLGGAIQNSYMVVASKRTDGQLVLCHTSIGQVFSVALADLDRFESDAVADRQRGTPMAQRATPVWAMHTLGAVREMISAGVEPSGGLNLLLTSNVPHGAGMSNSAANCVAAGLVFHAMYPRLNLGSELALVTFARQAEWSPFVGGTCGWLDQLLIVCSKESTLTKIDYADKGIEYFASELPPSMQFVAFNTNVPHVLAESDYAHRVKELTIGIQFLTAMRNGANSGGPNLTLGTLNALLQAVDPATPGNAPIELSSIGGGALLRSGLVRKEEERSELTAAELARIKKAVETTFKVPSELPMHRARSPLQSFAIALRRMRHQKMSSLLVPLAGEAAKRGDAALFGLLLDLEGASLRMSGDFMITGDNGAQDAMLDCALAAGKALGLPVHGRMLGGGGGGNVLLFVDTSDASKRRQWEVDTVTAYNAWAEAKFPGEGIQATVIVPSISAGARLL